MRYQDHAHVGGHRNLPTGGHLLLPTTDDVRVTIRLRRRACASIVAGEAALDEEELCTTTIPRTNPRLPAA
jgi:hypothetical protein